jgi:hypothetical protein
MSQGESGESMENVVPLPFAAKKMIPTCIDGRDETRFAIARPGGAAGLLMDVLAAASSFLPGEKKMGEAEMEQVAEAVVKAIGGMGRFHFHTDTQAAHGLNQDQQLLEANIFQGCGFMKNAMIKPEQFGADPGIVSFVARFAARAVKQQGPLLYTVYQGEHDEQAVDIVRSRDSGLKHRKGTGGSDFVYHETFDRELVARAAREICALPGLTGFELERLETNIWSRAQANLEAIRKILASNLPVRVVEIADGRIRKVQEVGSVQQRIGAIVAESGMATPASGSRPLC